MANVPKQERQKKIGKATSGAEAGIAELEDLSNSGNPDIAAEAFAQLVEARNVRDDLAATRALVENKPENALKPVSDEDLNQLQRLETAIDTRIRNNRLIQAGLNAATAIVQTSRSIGQILSEA